jgi:hypothetical protein
VGSGAVYVLLDLFREVPGRLPSGLAPEGGPTAASMR